jgi:AraC-like DNA-binding protein
VSKPPQRDLQRPDWVCLAQVWDHGLTPAKPLWVNAVGEIIEQPGPLQVHVHKGMDVGIVVTEGMELQYGDYLFRPRRGDVWLGGMWEPHSWRVVQAGTQTVQVCFLPDILEEQREHGLDLLRMFTVPASQRPRVTTESMRQEALTVASGIRREERHKRAGWTTVVRAELVRLLVFLLREWKPPGTFSGAVRAADLARIVPALALAHDAPDGRVSPRDGAAACKLSLRTFHAIFGRTMGISYGKFVERSRLAAAAQALLDTDLSVHAIADEAGFSDGSHLHRVFRSHYGCTPAEYRRRAMIALPTTEGTEWDPEPR